MATLAARVTALATAIGTAVKALRADVADIRSKLDPASTNLYVEDQDITIPASARVVLVSSLNSDCYLTLPPVLTFPVATILRVGDSSGAASESLPIYVVPNTGDTIAQSPGGLRIINPDQVIGFVRGAGRKWIAL